MRYYVRVIALIVALSIFFMFYASSSSRDKSKEKLDYEDFMKNVKHQNHDGNGPLVNDKDSTLFLYGVWGRKNITRIRMPQRKVSKNAFTILPNKNIHSTAFLKVFDQIKLELSGYLTIAL